jgi:apolipoprotein N-acyltransferase
MVVDNSSQQSAAPARVVWSARFAGLTSAARGWVAGVWPAFKVCLPGSLLWWASLPPLNLAPLAWFAPWGWILLVRRTTLPGERPWMGVWLAGLVYWILTLHWLRLPHPATSIGWVALSVYLACYLPLVVAAARHLVHAWRFPVMVAAPVAFVGTELLQARLLSGFSLASLAHSQASWISIIQIADLGGQSTVSGLIVFVAACLARCVPLSGARPTPWPLGVAAFALAAALAYGEARRQPPATAPRLRVALIQGSIDTEIKTDPARVETIHREYLGLSRQAAASQPRPQLVIWPETMYRHSWILVDDDYTPAPDEGWTLDDLRVHQGVTRTELVHLARELQAPLLIGLDTTHFGTTRRRYNSALAVAPDGTIGPRYDKMHPVLFGEYVPFGRVLSWLHRFLPLPAGVDAGQDLPSFQLAGWRLAPNICFESTVPHLIRHQVHALDARGESPDLLVNLTNDGWFWGSSELDLHLLCGVFRAIEVRRPLVIAANTGFSASIDGSGNIRAQGPRRATAIVWADVVRDGRGSLYLWWGDVPAGCCAAVLLAAIVDSARRRWQKQPTPSA